MLARSSISPTGRRSRSLSIRSLALPLTDTVTIIACISLTGFINLSFDNFTDSRGLIVVSLILGAIVAFQQMGHYNRRRQLWQEIGDVAAVAAVLMVLDAAMLYLLKVNFSRVWVVSSWVLVMAAVPIGRLAIKRLSLSLGGWRQPTVIVGTGPLAREAARAHVGDVHMGYDVIAFVDPDREGAADVERHIEIGRVRIPVYNSDQSAGGIPGWLGGPHVILALELDQIARQEELIETLSLENGDIDMISPIRGLPINNTKTTHFFSFDILSLRISNNLARPWSQMLKRLFDIAGASALLVFLAPIMILVMLKLKLEGGNVFFGHTRVGRKGQLFKCLKFRSMVANSADVLANLLSTNPAARVEWERNFKLKNDPRVTPFGQFLRKSSLDELPQLFNVLRGDMSLVGPRPVVPDELERYGQAKIYYLEVRPGLTGLWQISGRSDLDYDQRVNLDTWYVRNWTLWYDILILFKTVLVVPSKASGAY